MSRAADVNKTGRKTGAKKPCEFLAGAAPHHLAHEIRLGRRGEDDDGHAAVAISLRSRLIYNDGPSSLTGSEVDSLKRV